MSETGLKTIDLCRHYKRGQHTVKAVDFVSIDIYKGEYLSVVGSSGSGKSTLLNLLAGLDTPTSGSIEYKGNLLSRMSRKELARYRAHKVGMVFQSFNLITHLDAVQNVAMALYFDNTPAAKRKQIAVETLEKLGLGDRLDHLPSDLSGGEQQRVAVARALVKNPEILFADEPTGNLDRENSEQITELLKEQNKRGLTIVMVTHDLELARKHSDRIIKMHYGQIESITGERQ